ncbi:MAG: DinB family protein [Candidatus Limnocylindria bacterium]
MTRTALDDAFDHHVWATLRLLDMCLDLSPEQLAATAPGTYGSILDTIRHLVGADAAYLYVLTGGRVAQIDEEEMDVPELRSAMADFGPAWSELLAGEPDPEQVVVRKRDDGSESRAPMSVRLAQALHHGTDHRSQVCTVLTTLGIEPPEIDVWAYAHADGRLVMTEPA